jgi:hypothetical protein
MWIKTNDTWIKQVETKETIDNSLNTEITYYSKCLDSISYTHINDITNIYPNTELLKSDNWYVNSPYSIGTTGDKDIYTNTVEYSKYLIEYNNKNSYTPSDAIISNYLYVDIATTEIIDITAKYIQIDGVNLKHGHRILVKDQIAIEILSDSIDPEVYFSTDIIYHISEEDTDASTITYYYYTSENGIYTYDNGNLLRSTELSTYQKLYSVYVKEGTQKTQFHLEKNRTGYYPIDNEPMEFIDEDRKNYLMRHKVSYINNLDVEYNACYFQEDQVIDSLNINEKKIYIGNFGTILVKEDIHVNIIFNEIKEDLTSISATEEYYWIVGKRGTLLKVSKIDLSIEYIETGTINDFSSISFFGNRAIIVGNLNQILYTLNSKTWHTLEIADYENFKYNEVLFDSLDTAYIVGDNGVFIKLTTDGSTWTNEKLNPIKIESDDDSYDLIEDITSMSTYLDNIVLVGSNSTIILYDKNTLETFYLSIGTSSDIFSCVVKGSDIYITSDAFYSLAIPTLTLTDTNIMDTSGTLTLLESKVYNDVYYNANSDIFLLPGNNLVIDTYTTAINDELINLTIDYRDSLRPKFPILDYDIANKVNFIGDDLTYRLPNPGTQFKPNSYLEVEFISKTGEISWIDLYKEFMHTYQYNTTLVLANKVTFNSKFRYDATMDQVFTIADKTNDEAEMTDLLNVTATASLFNVFFADNTLIIRTALATEIGDIYEISSDIIYGTIMVNRVETLGGDQFIYFNTGFDTLISNELSQDTSNFTIRNLNLYDTDDDFTERFNLHYMNNAYIATGNTGLLKTIIEGRQTSKSTYYNLELEIFLDGVSHTTLGYSDLFLNFGYTARYNLLDYLYNIDPVFIASKEFLAMPIYDNLTIGGATTDHVNVADNKLYFLPALLIEYNAILVNTWLDLTITGDTVETTRVFVMKKYYDSTLDRYIIDFNEEIIVPVNPSTIQIYSRRRLDEISYDLDRSNNTLNFKPNTNSYNQIFMSDFDIKDKVTSVMYMDESNDLAFDIHNLPETISLDITSIISSPIFGSYIGIKVLTSTVHNLEVGDYIVIDSGIYQGYHTINTVASTTQVVIRTPYISDEVSGTLTNRIFDNSFGYTPLDLIQVSLDESVVDYNKYSVEINYKNISTTSNVTSIIDLDESVYRFNLIDGLDIVRVFSDFSWILEAEISNATIGIDSDDKIVWYTGNWYCGRWFDGTWYNGTWFDGTWYNGTWNSNQVAVTKISKKVLHADINASKWLNGVWKTGTFVNGTWFDGTWNNGTWTDGSWFGGQWDDGTHTTGIWKRGTWVSGTWTDGTFNSSHGLSTWIDGTFFAGTFESGVWKNGTFYGTFGTASTNSQKSIWESGIWNGIEFHSNDNTNSKYSIWKTGIWNSGTFKSGTTYNIEFNSGTWENGVSNEIDLISVFLNGTSGYWEITIDGEYPFNRNTYISFLNSNNNLVGSVYTEQKFKIQDVNYNYNASNVIISTKLTVYEDASALTTTDKLVSTFKLTDWKNGIWVNGIWDGDYFRNGMWLNGLYLDGEFS